MKYGKGKQTCAWCHWRYSRNGHKHECEALACPKVAIRGCYCEDCDYRKYNRCPLESGMKGKTEWCECGLAYERGEHPEIGLDSVCAMFKPIDFNSYCSWQWNPVAVKKAAAKAKDCKSNPTADRRATEKEKTHE